MTGVRVIALGSRTVCDDDVALVAVEQADLDAEVVLAGRPGPGLLDLLDEMTPTVIVDAVLAQTEAGSLVELPLTDLTDAARGGGSVSSHGLGPAQTLRLGRALGRPLPPGVFVGLVGRQFEPGRGRSPEVDAALASLTAAVQSAVRRLAER